MLSEGIHVQRIVAEQHALLLLGHLEAERQDADRRSPSADSRWNRPCGPSRSIRTPGAGRRDFPAPPPAASRTRDWSACIPTAGVSPAAPRRASSPSAHRAASRVTAPRRSRPRSARPSSWEMPRTRLPGSGWRPGSASSAPACGDPRCRIAASRRRRARCSACRRHAVRSTGHSPAPRRRSASSADGRAAPTSSSPTGSARTASHRRASRFPSRRRPDRPAAPGSRRAAAAPDRRSRAPASRSSPSTAPPPRPDCATCCRRAAAPARRSRCCRRSSSCSRMKATSEPGSPPPGGHESRREVFGEKRG